MSETTVFQSAQTGRVFGVTSHAVFASPNASSPELASSIRDGADPKQVLGKECVTIPIEKIKSIQVLENETGLVFVAAKGLADDIQVETGPAEVRNQFVEAIKARLGPAVKETRGKASLLQTAPKLVAATLIIAILTVGGFMGARQIEAGQYQESTKIGLRGNQERGFAAIVGVLGPVGTLAVGLPILAGATAMLWRKAKNRPERVTLTP